VATGGFKSIRERGIRVTGWINASLALYLLLGAWYGLRRGLVSVVFSVLGYVVGLVLASHEEARLTRWLLRQPTIHRTVFHLIPQAATTIPSVHRQALHLIQSLMAFVVFLLLVGLAEGLGRVIGQIISRTVHSFRVTGLVDRVGGVVAGLFEHGIVAGLVMVLILTVPVFAHTPLLGAIHKAPLASWLVSWVGRLAKIPGGLYL